MNSKSSESTTGSIIAARVILLIVVAAALGAVTGCKAAPASDTDFVKGGAMTNDPSLPFHRMWRSPDWDPQRYTKIYVAEVNTDYMMQMTEWQQGTRQDSFDQDVRDLGLFTRDTLKKAFQDDPQHRFVVVGSPPTDPDAIILEVALTEVVPSKVVLNMLGFAPFFIGTTINAARAVAEDRSSVALEARLRDARTDEVVLMLADREAQQGAPANVKSMSWYGQSKGIIKDWADQFVEATNRKPGEVVEDTKPFTLKPW